MGKTLYLICLMVLLSASSCSFINKDIYLSPVSSQRWLPIKDRIHEKNPRQYVCDDFSITVYTHVWSRTLVLGPPFLPIFPVTGARSGALDFSAIIEVMG